MLEYLPLLTLNVFLGMLFMVDLSTWYTRIVNYNVFANQLTVLVPTKAYETWLQSTRWTGNMFMGTTCLSVGNVGPLVYG